VSVSWGQKKSGRGEKPSNPYNSRKIEGKELEDMAVGEKGGTRDQFHKRVGVG